VCDDRNVQKVEVEAIPIERLARLLDGQRGARFRASADRARALLAGRTVWNINATATGGGVAEMLQSLLAYGRGVGVDTRWLALDGTPGFFQLTKRLPQQAARHGGRRRPRRRGPATGVRGSPRSEPRAGAHGRPTR
jgi:hypothetical protein